MTEAAIIVPLVNSSSHEHLLARQAELAHRPSRPTFPNIAVRAALDATAYLAPDDNPPESLRALRTIPGYEETRFQPIGREALVALTGTSTGNKGLSLNVATHHLEHREVAVERWTAWLKEAAADYEELVADILEGSNTPTPGTDPYGPYSRHTAHVWEFNGTSTIRGKTYAIEGALKAGGGGVAKLSPVTEPAPTAKSHKKFSWSGIMNIF